MASGEVAQCRALLRRLKDFGTKGSVADPELRQLRERFRDTCAKALQLEYELAQKDDIERKLWRFAFYSPIGEFRARLAAPHVPDALRAKTLATYAKFLSEAELFYSGLIAHLKSALQASYQGDNSPASASVASLRASLARCLICVGDLRRYAATAAGTQQAQQPTEDDVKESRFALARESYAAAVAAAPESGNAYNQIAVLDESEGDTLAAAFFYLRAHHAQQAFPIGQQNAALLFGSAVQQDNQQLLAGNGKSIAKHRGARPTATLEKDISSRYLTLFGTLFERIDVDATPRRLALAGNDLDDLLHRLKQQASSGGPGGAARRVSRSVATAPQSVEAAAAQRPLPLLLLVVSIPLLLIHGADASRADGELNVAAAAARGYTLSVLLDTLSRLASIASKLKLGEKGPLGDAAFATSVFPALAVALEWLVLHQGQPALAQNSSDRAVAGAADVAAIAEKTVQGLEKNRIAAWRGLAALSSAMSKCNGLNDGEILRESDGGTADEWPIPLPEDLLLVSFPPLLASGKAAEESTMEIDGVERWKAGMEEEESVLPNDVGIPGFQRARRVWRNIQQLYDHAQAWVRLQKHQQEQQQEQQGDEGRDREQDEDGSGGGTNNRELMEAVEAFIEAARASNRVNINGNGIHRDNTPETGPEMELSGVSRKNDEDISAAMPAPLSDQCQELEDQGANGGDREDGMDIDEEIIVYAPLSAARRSSSAALLRSGTSSPAPLAPLARSPSPQLMHYVNTPDERRGPNNNTGDGASGAGARFRFGPSGGDANINVATRASDQPQLKDYLPADMERTYQEMAARVLSTEDREVGMQYQDSRNQDQQQYLPPPVPSAHSPLFGQFPGNQGYISLFGDLGGAGTLFGAPQTGTALFSSPLGNSGTSLWPAIPPPVPHPPPLPSPGLHAPPVLAMQQPAEGLRAVLFGSGSGLRPGGQTGLGESGDGPGPWGLGE